MDPAGLQLLEGIPALSPPPGVLSNFVNPPTLGPTLIALNAVFLPLTIISVTIRIYVKGRIVHAIGWDDYVCIVAALGSVVHTIMMMNALHLGYGRHMYDIRAISLTPDIVHLLVSLAVLYPIVIFLVKLSIFLLYLRLFGVSRPFRYLVYAGLIFQALFYTSWLGLEIASTVICSTVENLGSPLCTANVPLVVSQGAVNVVTDLYMVALPIPQVLRLQMQTRRKIGLVAIFLAGFIACLMSIARLVNAAVRYYDPDILYWAAATSEYTVVEINLGIITACMSTLPIFVSKSALFRSTTYSSLRSRLFGSRWQSDKSSGMHSEQSSKKVYGSKSSKAENEMAHSGRVNERYLELRDAGEFHTEEKGGRDTKGGIMKTVDYGISGERV